MSMRGVSCTFPTEFCIFNLRTPSTRYGAAPASAPIESQRGLDASPTKRQRVVTMGLARSGGKITRLSENVPGKYKTQ